MRTDAKKWVSIFVLAILVTWCNSGVLASEENIKAGNAATVNGSAITMQTLLWELDRAEKRLAKKGKTLTADEVNTLKVQILENLIDFELLYQESEKKGITVEDKEIKDQLDKLRNSYPSEEAFQKEIKDQNFSVDTLRSLTRKGLVVKKFINTQIAKDVTVSDEEVKDYYEKNPTLFVSPDQVRASHILITLDPKATEAEKAKVRKELEEIRARAEKGEDFGALAKVFSKGPSATRGGDLGYFPQGRMEPSFEKAAFSLKKGEMSGIVESSYGYHLIKVTDKRPKAVIPLDVIKPRIKQYVKAVKVQEKIGAVVKELREKAVMERFVSDKK